MEALINGTAVILDTRTTLGDLLSLYRLNPAVVIIEHNGIIVKQSSWATTPIKEKDTIELISFVGGG